MTHTDSNATSRWPLALSSKVSRGAALLATLFALGCGASNDNMGRVEGEVTIDGVPAAEGAISFSPVDGKSPTAGGKIADGRYAAEVPIGVSTVAIRVPKVVGQRKLYDTPDSPVQPVMAESLPAKYNIDSELTIDVKPGDNEHNFPLDSK